MALKALASLITTKLRGVSTLSSLSVRGRLLLAFFGISGFAVLAAAAAMYSFLQVGKVVETIAQRKAPPALASLELSSQAERVVAAAPALLSVTTTAQHDENSKKVAAELGRLSELLSKLQNSDLDACAYRELHSSVAMMQATDHGLHNDATKSFDWSDDRRILGQRQVRTSFIVVAGIFGHSPTKV